jgi:hypothetical protein
LIDEWDDIPHAEELNLDVDGKGSLKLHAQLKTLIIIPRVHSVRERQLLDVELREKPDFLEHTGKSTGGEGTARESENADLIPSVV